MKQSIHTVATIFAAILLIMPAAECGNKKSKISDSDIKGLSLGMTLNSVVDKLGSPYQRGHKVRLESEATVIREYPRSLEACVWHGERSYLLSFRLGHLVQKEAFPPSLTKVSIQEMPKEDIRYGDDIMVTVTKKGRLWGGDKL